MKIEVTIEDKEIRQVLADYVSEKCGQTIKADEIKLLVKSKENYRLKTFEQATLLITNKSEPATQPTHEDTELKVEVVSNG